MQFIAYVVIYPFLWLISILPFRLLYIISDVLFIMIYYVIGYRKKTVKDNLKLVFPDKSQKEIQEIARKFYHHLCDMILESIKSLTISESAMRNRFQFTNIDELKKFEDQNRSVMLMCSHYANFEWSLVLQRYLNFKGYAIYKRLANKYFDRLVRRIRARYNSYLITTKESIPTLIEAKKNGELTINGFAADQSPKINKAYHANYFMGIKVPVHTGAEMLAKKLDMAVVFMDVQKVKRGFYEATFTTLTDDPKSFKNYQVTDMFIKHVEAQIYKAPEYYLWTHKRWKHKDNLPPNLARA